MIRHRMTLERPVPSIGMKLHQVALALDVSPNTVLKMVEEGRLPPPRQWHSLRIWRTAEIDAALAEWPSDGEPVEAGGSAEEWKAEA